MRRALDLALEQGQGRETAHPQQPRRASLELYEGPQAALDALREGIAFCERRGHHRVRARMRADQPAFLAELGQPQQALAEPGRSRSRLQATGDIASVDARVRAAAPARRARRPPSAAPDRRRLAAAAATLATAADRARFAAAAPAAARPRQPEQARTLLRELDELPASAATTSLLRSLPSSCAARSLSTTRRSPAARRRRRARSRRSHEHALCAAPSPARRSRRRARRRRRALRGCGRALARVRQRARTRLRSARPGPLPGRAR